MRLVRACLLWSGPQSLGHAMALTVAAGVRSVAMAPRLFVVDGDVLTDGHALASLELAMARAYCGQLSAYSPTVRVPYDVRDTGALRTVPLQELVVRRAGSIDAYCQTATVPFVNNENALMLLETVVLRAAPGISTAQVGQALHLVRIAGVVVFVLALMSLGGSVALGVGTLLCGLLILYRMHDQIYSNYPFFFSMLLVEAAILGLAARYRFATSPAGLALVGLTAGALAAWVTNMRTSFFPIQTVFLAALALCVWVPRAPGVSRTRLLVGTLVMTGLFVAAYQSFQYGFITRGLPADGRHGASHTIGHPLVLSLGVPQTDFSRREGLTWLDEVGRQKALSVDPEAIYLGPRYDAALLRYYRELWRTHTGDMLDLYRTKFSVAGVDMISTFRQLPGRDGRLLYWLLWPVSHVPDGRYLMAVYALATLAGLAFFLRTGAPGALGGAFLSAAAALSHLEVGIIYSLFVDQYHNYLVFYVLFLSMVLVQVVLNAGGYAFNRVISAAWPRA